MPSERAGDKPLPPPESPRGHVFIGMAGDWLATEPCQRCGQPRAAHEPPAEPKPPEAFRELAVIVGEDVAHLTEADIGAVRKFGLAQPHPAPDPEDRLFGAALNADSTCVHSDDICIDCCHAALVRVVAEEREACARIAEAHVKPKLPYKPGEGYAEVAAAIRARGLEEL